MTESKMPVSGVDPEVSLFLDVAGLWDGVMTLPEPTKSNIVAATKVAIDQVRQRVLPWQPSSEPPDHEDIILVVDAEGALFVATYDGEQYVELAYGPRQVIPDASLWCEIEVPNGDGTAQTEAQRTADAAQHRLRHQVLHKHLDELLADYIRHTGARPSQTSLMAFLQWSAEQTKKPTDLAP